MLVPAKPANELARIAIVQSLLIRIEYSVGKVPFDGSRHPSVEALLKEADALMYEQKRLSRAATPRAPTSIS